MIKKSNGHLQQDGRLQRLVLRGVRVVERLLRDVEIQPHFQLQRVEANTGGAIFGQLETLTTFASVRANCVLTVLLATAILEVTNMANYACV